MEPLIAVTLDRPQGDYDAGHTLRLEYQIDAVDPQQIVATEASVLWHTEGKGEPEIGVHFFRRTTRDEFHDRDIRPMQRIDVELPASPLSYEGVILKIRWCVRVRLFLAGGREFMEERPFTLGGIPPAQAARDEIATDDEDIDEQADAAAQGAEQPAAAKG